MTTGKVLVVGPGIMGTGIAQTCAAHGFATILTGETLASAVRAVRRIEKALEGKVKKGKLGAQEMATILSRITPVEGYDAAGMDVIIETVPEDLIVKKAVLAELGESASPQALLATNTTALSISDIAAAYPYPERVVQMHFFNPPTVMKLVEIMPGQKTSPQALADAKALAEALGKEPVVCQSEAPAGIVSRILGQLLNEATWLVQDGVADPEAVDRAMTLGAGHPMGPLKLLDMIGLDTHRAKMQSLRTQFNDPRYEHPPLVDALIAEGRLGRKAGRGFYTYDTPPSPEPGKESGA